MALTTAPPEWSPLTDLSVAIRDVGHECRQQSGCRLGIFEHRGVSDAVQQLDAHVGNHAVLAGCGQRSISAVLDAKDHLHRQSKRCEPVRDTALSNVFERAACGASEGMVGHALDAVDDIAW